jgi:diguanylate cyclase (GGDEF)-like protein
LTVTRLETTAGSPPTGPAAEAPFQTTDVFAAIGEAPYEWRIGSDALVWGANAPDVLKVTDASLIASGRAYAKLLDADNVQTRFDAISRVTAIDTGTGVAYQAQYRLRPTPDTDARLWIEDVGRWFAGADGKPARALGVVRVINERRAQEERLAYLSRFDALTGELNRWHLTDVLAATVEDAIRCRTSCAFLIVAIDNLAHVNEAYGFDVADEVISAVAKRLRAKMRGGDTVGRFSGNKFGVVLKTCTPDDIATAAERVLASVRDDVVQTQAGPVAVTVTVGGVNAPRHARTVQEVLARAQEALDAAKAKRRGSFHAYRPNVEREAVRRRNVRSNDEIVRALNERRITIAFEPVVSAAARTATFYECLMRIRRADGSLIAAGEVIPLAERLGLVRLIDYRVLDLVVEELVGASALKASLNVSAASTVDPEWWAALATALRAHPTVASRLTVEITESAAIQDLDDTRGFVARVKDVGCRIAIDDFGAGYTSFRNLRKLGVDVIKIDGAFVQNLPRSEDDRAFVRTLIDLAKRLGLETVAEWVQDEEAAAILADWGCDYLQGHLIGLASLDRPWATQSAA